MKKFKFDSGQVRADITKEKHTKKNRYTITFLLRNSYGWGISLDIDKDKYDSFDLKQARLFAEKAEPMINFFS